MTPLPLVDLFSDFAASSWRAAWLIVVLAILRIVVRGRIPAGVWFVAWIIVALRLLIPFSVPVSWSPYNLMAPRLPTTAVVAVTPAPAAVALEANAIANPDPTVVADTFVAPATPSARWTPGEVLALVWLTGAAGLLIVRAGAAWQFRRRLRHVWETDARVRTITEREAQTWDISRPVRCVETDAVDAPALFGLRRPWLLFPRGFAAQLSDDELRLVVRHELAHWRRRDLAAQALLQVAVALHWFNPLAWLAARLARVDCELACDEFVLRREASDGASAYGSTLLKVLGVMRGRRRPGTVVAILEGKQQLAQRVRMIAGYQGSTTRRVFGGVLLLALLAAASATREAQAQGKPPAAIASQAVSAPAVETASAPTPESERHPSRDYAVDYLNTMADTQRKRVDVLAQQLQAFKEKNKLGSLDQRRDIVNESLKAITLEVQRATLQLEAARTRFDQIKDGRARGADLTSLSFVAGQPLVAELQKQLVAQRISVAALNERYREAHPAMVSARNALDQTQRELDRAVKSVCDQVEGEFSSAAKNLQSRQQDLDRNRVEASELDRATEEYRQLEREYLTQNQILQSIIARARDAASASNRGSRATDVQPAAPVAANASSASEPLSVVFQKKPSGWVLTETRGNQDELAKSAEQIQALRTNLETSPSPTPRSSTSTGTSPRADADEFFVSVLGAVNAQGSFPLRAEQKPIALDAIARAGGFAPNADRTGVRLIRLASDGARTTKALPEDELMNGGVFLQRGDVVIVSAVAAPMPRYATVMGAVNQPGRITFPTDRKLTIVDLISMAGGPSRLADLKKVRLTRANPATESATVTIINVDGIWRGSEPKTANVDLEAGDMVMVPERIL